MEFLGFLLICSGVLLMFFNTLFIWNASQLIEYYPPILSMLIFIVITFISIVFLFTGFNINIFIPYIL
jgi:hypothetical protein